MISMTESIMYGDQFTYLDTINGQRPVMISFSYGAFVSRF